MIPSIAAKIKAIREFEENLNRTIIDTVRDYEAEVIDMNTQQLEKGIYCDGTPILPEYTPFTVSLKKERGRVTDRVTLKDEGDFHDAFFVTYGDDYLVLDSRDPKTNKLKNKYGEEIFGLTQDNIKEVTELIKPDLLDLFQKQVGI